MVHNFVPKCTLVRRLTFIDGDPLLLGEEPHGRMRREPLLGPFYSAAPELRKPTCTARLGNDGGLTYLPYKPLHGPCAIL